MEENKVPKKRKIIRRKTEVLSVAQPISDRMQIKEKLLYIIGKIADEHDYQVYAVGGIVRDYYLNRPRNDFDFTVIGDAIAFAKIVAERLNTKAVVYERFRTALVPAGNYKCEFVGTRKEEYEEGSRKPKVTEGTFFDDLKRRDFTINAMAFSLNKKGFGQIVDMFKGKKDIEIRKLRTPLDPEITFSDDPLRMMRAARFAAQLNFSIDEQALTAMREMKDRIKIVSQERITDEFLKIINSDHPGKGLRIMHNTGLLKHVFPDLSKLSGIDVVEEQNREFAHKDVLLHSIKVLDNIAPHTDNTWLRFAALIHDIGKSVTKKFEKGKGWTFHGHEELGARRVKKIFKYLKLPLEHVDYVEKLVRLHQRPMTLVDDGITDSAVRRLAVQADEALEDLFKLCRADITTKNPDLSIKYLLNYDKVATKVVIVQEKDKLRAFQSPVNGEEIMENCGIGPSRAVGFIKDSIEEAILDGLIKNDYEAAKKYFLENKEEWLDNIKRWGI